MSSIFLILFVITGGYAGVAALILLFQSKLLYFPSSDLVQTPDLIGLRYEQVWFKTEDDISLYGWYLPSEKSDAVLLFFHGNAGNISHRLESLVIFNELGLSSFIFDYRGFGQSKGEISEQGTYLDAEAALHYLSKEKQIAASRMVYFGRSLGGAIAAQLATNYPPKALIIESSFTSIPDLAEEIYPFLPVRWMSRFKYSTSEYLQTISSPVLIIHSPDDEIISIKHGRELYAMSNQPKQFLEIRGAHNDGFYRSKRVYMKGIKQFLDLHLGDEKSLN